MSSERKVVIVTGASQGIGAGLVRAYRDRDYRVVANSRSISPGADPDVLAVAGDIGEPETAERIVSTALERFGRIDTLVNNAGVFLSKPFIEFTEDDFARNMAINVAGFFHITQRAAAAMLKQGSGHIVSITTTLVDQPMAGVPAALASLTKGALNAVTRSLAIEFAARGVRVNAVAPGIIKTPMHPVETHAAFAALHPVGRMGEIRDVVDAVLFLESGVLRHRRDPPRRRRPARRTLVTPARILPLPKEESRMPIVTIQVTREGTTPGRTSVSAEEKAALIKGVSELLLEVLNKPLESTFVVIEEVDTENWGWGGLPVLDYRRRRAAATSDPDRAT